MRPYKTKNQISRMSKLEIWENHLETLYDLQRKGKKVEGMIATYEDKIRIYKKAQMLN